MTYHVNAAGRVDSVLAGSATYAQVSATWASGAPKSYTYGVNIQLQDTYNPLLQLQTQTATQISPSYTLFNKTYDFHSGSGDNGLLWAVTDGMDALGLSRPNGSVTYTYDTLNRLTSAQTSGTACTAVNGGALNWGNSYTIDPWGNLTAKTVTKCSAETLSASATVQNQLAAATYDSAGNAVSYNGTSFAYNAAGQIVSAAGIAYTYDGTGNRVSKPNKLYWYGTNSAALSETSTSDTAPTRYILFNGKRIGRLDPGTSSLKYYVSDNLGSAAVETDSSGNILSESEYFPYGGEQQVIPDDSNAYKYAGKERDSESGLDDFGARYYLSKLGRFMSPDWDAKPTSVPYASFGDPQTLNLYSYVENAPLNRVDADGHAPLQNYWEPGRCSAGAGCVDPSDPSDYGVGGTPDYGTPEQQQEESAQADATTQAAVAGQNLAAAQQQASNGTTSIVSVSATSSAPAMALGGLIGEAVDPAGGGVVGALLGSTIGVGANVSYVPSTDSWYAGPTATFSPILFSGTGVSGNAVIVPSTQNPNSIANGQSYSVTLQPTPLTGTTVTKSPGSGPPVAGPSIGTKVPVAFGASYNFNITPAVNAAKAFVNNAINTVRSWF